MYIRDREIARTTFEPLLSPSGLGAAPPHTPPPRARGGQGEAALAP